MKAADFAALIWLGVVFAMGYGWIMNIVTIAHSSFSDVTGVLVLRVVGIFVAPLGSVMGFL